MILRERRQKEELSSVLERRPCEEVISEWAFGGGGKGRVSQRRDRMGKGRVIWGMRNSIRRSTEERNI